MALDIHPLRALFTLFGYTAGRPPRITRAGQAVDPAAMSPAAVSKGTYDWFQEETKLAASRLSRHREYATMDSDDIISSALDLYAEDASQTDSATGRSIWVTGPNSEIVKLANDTLQTVGMEEKVFPITRGIAKYGDHYEAVLQAENTGGFPTRVAGMRVQRVSDIVRYEDGLGRLRGFVVGPPDQLSDMAASGRTIEVSQPWDFVHWRLSSRTDEDAVYGTSVLFPARRIYRYLRLMEESLAIYRIRRNPDRLKWKIPVPGGLLPEEVSDIVNSFRQVVRKKFLTDPGTGQVRSEMNPLALDEDFYLPWSEDYPADVSVLKGSPLTDRVLDIDYMRKKLFGCLRIPPDYMGFTEAKGTLAGNSALSDQDIRFARGVKRLQRAVMIGTVQLIKIDLLLRGIDVNKPENQFRVLMHPVSYLDELQQAETAKIRAGVVADLLAVGDQIGVNKATWLKYVTRQSGFPEDVLTSVTTGESADVKRDELVERLLVNFRRFSGQQLGSEVRSEDYPLQLALGSSDSICVDKAMIQESVKSRKKTPTRVKITIIEGDEPDEFGEYVLTEDDAEPIKETSDDRRECTDS